MKKINIFSLLLIFFFLPLYTGYLKKLYQKSTLKKSMLPQIASKQVGLYKNMFTNFRKLNKKNIMLWWQGLKNKIAYTRLLKKKKILSPLSSLQLLKSTQLLKSGKSPVLPLNEHVLAYEKEALEEVELAFNFGYMEWKEITEKIKEIREKNLAHLTSSNPSLEDFSSTHEQLPQHIKKILYDTLATYNINPQRIKIEISDLMPDNIDFYFAAVSDNNILYLNRLMLEKPNTFLKALIGHEIGHLIQGDVAGAFDILLKQIETRSDIEIIWSGKTGKEKTRKLHPSKSQEAAIRSFVGSIEFTADALIASRKIDVARAMFYSRQLEVPDLMCTYEKFFIKRAEEEKKREGELSLYKKFYPDSLTSSYRFLNTMRKIWGPDWLSPLHSPLKIKEK